MAITKKSNKSDSLIDQIKHKLTKKVDSTQHGIAENPTKYEKTKKIMTDSISEPKTTKKFVHKTITEVNSRAMQKKRKHSQSINLCDEDILASKFKMNLEPSIDATYGLYKSKTFIQEPGDDDQSEDEEEVNKHSQGEQKKRRKLSRQEREQEDAAQEAAVRAAELTRVSGPRAPTTEHDYRELLLSNSSCSATWIQYISFMVASGDHERARTIARNGLSKIPCEEQKERINLWTVLLRLEVQYCPDASVAEKTLTEATTNCDPYTMLCNMADIYQENDMLEKAEVIYRRLTKKFYAELDAWVKFGQFYFTTKKFHEARETLTKALVVLKNKTGVDVTNRFAQMEMKYGDRVKACSMFESLLANYPKRLDVWNVFVDLLIKYEDFEQARAVFSRMHVLPIRFNKKITILRKWQDFENHHGDALSQKSVQKILTDFSNENMP